MSRPRWGALAAAVAGVLLVASVPGTAVPATTAPATAAPAEVAARGDTEQPQTLAVPRMGCLYHGVYPGGVTGEEDDITPADVASYEAAAGRSVAWVYFSNNWYRSRAFPLGKARWIREGGAVPFIRLMLRHTSNERDRDDGPDRTFSLLRIIRGGFDAELRAWGRAAREFGTPVLAEYGTEVNGFWFSWNATHNGRSAGARRFVRAYRHIIDVVRSKGATNVSWVFHVNDSDQPHRPWNRLERYYPGDRYIDWLSTSVYGALTPTENWNQAFAKAMDRVYPRLRALAPDKPIMVGEFGVTDGNDRVEPTVWARRALDGLFSKRWPRVRGFSWWNETWQNDNRPAHDSELRIQRIPGMAELFQDRLGPSAHVLDAPVIGGRASCG